MINQQQQNPQNESNLDKQKQLAQRRALTAQSAPSKGQRAGGNEIPIPKQKGLTPAKGLLYAVAASGLGVGAGLWFS